MTQRSDELMETLLRRLRQRPEVATQLPDPEGPMVQEALQGRSVYEIAQDHQMSEEAVWQVLSNAAHLAGGDVAQQRPEVAGLGSDIDPGVSGGYGETAFGSLGNEPPEPLPEEPSPEE